MAGFDNIKDKSLLGNKGEELLRQRQRRMQQKSVEETRLMADLVKELDQLNKAYETFDDMIEQNSVQMVKRIRDTRAQIEKARQAHSANVQRQFFGGVSTQLGQRATTEQITSVSRGSGMFGQALSTAQSTQTSDLESGIARDRRLLGMQRDRILETAANIEEPGMRARFQLQMGAQQKIVQRIGESEAALRAQRKLGIDTQSQYYGAQQTAQRVRGERERYQIAEDVAAGRAGSRRDVQDRLNDVGARLVSTFERLDQAVKTQSEDVASLTEEFKKLESEYSQASETARQMDRQGMGGSDRFRNLSQFFGLVGDAGVMAQGLGQGFRYNYVTSEMEQTQNRIGFANLANTRFQDQMGAARGDAGALRRMLSGTFERASRRGALFGGREENALTMELAGKGAQLAGAGIQSAADQAGPGELFETAVTGFMGSPVAAKAKVAAGVGAGMTADALQFNELLTNYRKNLSAGRTTLGAANQQIELENAINVIPDYMNQTMIDRLKGTTLATRGLGLGGGATSGRATVGGIGGLGGTPVNTAVTSDIDANSIFSLAEQFGGGGFSKGDQTPTPEKIDIIRRMMNGQMDPATVRGARGFASRREIERFTNRQPGAGVGGRADPYSTDIATGTNDRESLARLLNDPANARALAGAGLEGQGLYQAVGAGIQGLGKEMAGQGGLQSLMAAGQFTQAGYFQSPQQYMQARTALTGVGGGAQDLEKIMRNAVAAGMDSSKNIMQMVNATTQLSQTSATAGISAVGGARAALGRGIQTLRGQGVSENMAVGAAQRAAATAQGMATSKEMDIFNVMEFAELRSDFGDAELYELEALQTADPQELEQLAQIFQSKGDQAGQAAARRMGMGAIKSIDDVRSAQNTTRRQVLNRTMGIGINERLRKEIVGGVGKKKFSDLTPEAQDFLNARARQQDRGLSGAALYAGQQFEGGPGEGGLRRGGQGTITAGGERALAGEGIAQAEVFAQAVGKFDDSVKGLGQLGEIIAGFAEIDPGKMARETKEAAEKMQVPVSQFSDKLADANGTLGKFNAALQGAITKLLGLSGDSPLKNKEGEETRD